MVIVYKMYYDSNDYRFLIGNNMVVTNPDEWKKKVFEYVTTHYQKFLEEYNMDEDKPYSKENFEKWVLWCLKETVYEDVIKINNFNF